jgi:ribokinase
MAIFNLGSINADLVYQVPHLPAPGETLSAKSYSKGLGGKGTNMSVATARAGSRAVHIGAVGADGRWAVERLMEYGVDTRHILTTAEATGHAIIAVDDAGENSILIYPGANHDLASHEIEKALSEAGSDDIFVTQNETNCQYEGAKMASARGMRVAYAAAPFVVEVVEEMLPMLDLLILNEVEAAQLTEATGLLPQNLPVRDVVVTLGAKGSRWYNTDDAAVTDVPAVPVTPIDTTGAGDTFTGYLLAGLDQKMPMEQALKQASKASALMVTRLGTADVIPDLSEVRAFQP